MRTLMKFGCGWRKISHKGRCMKDSERTSKYLEVFHMKTTGVIRKLDELGRITLPIELRRSLNLEVKDALEITVQDDCIILKKSRKCRYFHRGNRKFSRI